MKTLTIFLSAIVLSVLFGCTSPPSIYIPLINRSGNPIAVATSYHNSGCISDTLMSEYASFSEVSNNESYSIYVGEEDYEEYNFLHKKADIFSILS